MEEKNINVNEVEVVDGPIKDFWKKNKKTIILGGIFVGSLVTIYTVYKAGLSNADIIENVPTLLTTTTETVSEVAEAATDI